MKRVAISPEKAITMSNVRHQAGTDELLFLHSGNVDGSRIIARASASSDLFASTFGAET